MSLGTVRRGCGKRVTGGIYAEVGLSPYGRPLEDFLIDPPLVADVDALGISAIGVTLVERAGVTHIADLVGSDSYPNVADFVEEIRRFGLSRRLPQTLDFSLLGPGSRIVLLHSRAHIDNFDAYYETINELSCPRPGPEGAPYHLIGGDECCAGLWWQDVEGGVDVDLLDFGRPREVVRRMPSFTYNAYRRPRWLDPPFEPVEPKYRPAFFMSLPISNLAVIRAADGSHVEALDRTAKCGLPVYSEDE